MAWAVDLSCALNLSEGRRTSVIARVVDAAAGACLVGDVSPDVDHNRTVITMLGSCEGLLAGILAASRVAVDRIDLSIHRGQHPRLGVVDVVPLTPVDPLKMEQAVECAVRSAEQLWSKLQIPCFLYESAARTPETRSLPWIRRHAFADLLPDVGTGGPHPSAGACVVGARPPLVAFNVNLNTGNLRLARAIAAEIRTTLPGVRALGLMMNDRGHAQVSVNITRTFECTMWDVFQAVDRLARIGDGRAVSSELVGLAPRHSFGVIDTTQLKLRREPKIFEDVLEALPE